jgi:ABC-type sugar transport system permease subunit
MAAVFILPALLIYLFFMVVPFIGTLQLSLTNWDGFQEVPEFIGLANYQYLLTDERMSNALLHNLAWVIIGTAAPILIALPLAIILWTGVKGRLFFRTVYFLPNILPLVVVGIVWGWIYNPLFGSLNTSLRAIGLGDIARGWLGTPDTALPAVLATAVWGYFGFCVVVLLAGLQNVDVELVDAARVDGANAFQRARHIVIPQLAPVLTTLTAITLIGGIQVFDIVFVMTQGGPGTATEVLATYTYKEAFTRNHVGYGSAVSMVITVLSLVLAVAFVRFRERTR